MWFGRERRQQTLRARERHEEYRGRHRALALIAHLLVDKGEHVEKARAEVEALNGMYKGEVPA